MSTFVNSILRLAMGAALVAVATAVPAAAQQGQFHLPFQAKWGGISLPPGDYRVSLANPATSVSMFLVRGPAGPSLILPLTRDSYGARSEPPPNDYLQLVKVNGEYFVTKFEVASTASTFFFKAPRPSRQVQISENVTNLPVSGN